MINIIIALLLQLGVISTEAEYHQTDAATQAEYREIIIIDLDGL